jgi:predicted dehydrogenase
LFDLVIHDIDFAQWVCGIPESIESYCLPGKLSNYDYISALWKYRDENLHVKIEGGNTYHSDYPFQASFNARFRNASIHYSSQDPAHITVASGSGLKLVPAGDANDGFSGELDYFLDCALHNRQPKCVLLNRHLKPSKSVTGTSGSFRQCNLDSFMCMKDDNPDP